MEYIDRFDPFPGEKVGLIRIARGALAGESDAHHLVAEINDPLLSETLRIMIAAGPPAIEDSDNPLESDDRLK